MILSITGMNFRAKPSQFRIERQAMKAVIELPEIFVSLLAPPGILGISGYGFKIGQGLYCKTESRHQAEFSLSNSSIIPSSE